MQENLSLVFATKSHTNKAVQLQEMVRGLRSRGIVLSIKRKTKALISYSAPLLSRMQKAGFLLLWLI